MKTKKEIKKMKNTAKKILSLVLALALAAGLAAASAETLQIGIPDDGTNLSRGIKLLETAGLITQAVAAFVGTLAFAGLFGVPRAQYVTSGLIGAVGWLLYLVLVRFAAVSPIIAVILSSVLICVLARIAAIDHKCPAQVFLLCGIFPLVPGAGIFWCTYYLVSGQLPPALTSGFGAVKVAVAIVLGIIVAMELPQRLFSRSKRRVDRPVH